MSQPSQDATALLRSRLLQGLAIPAHPLALNAKRQLDERRQRALTRYYCAAGVGGIAVGVHTTQFEIHDPEVGLLKPVLTLAREEMDRADANRPTPLVRVGGIVGKTPQAVGEAKLLCELGYEAGLLGLTALREESIDQLIEHAQAVADVIPIVGFYLNPAVGGRLLPYTFWRRLAEIDNLVAIKMAPFNRYQTLDVVRALVDSGREDIALYTGNDDNIIADLITPFSFSGEVDTKVMRIVGGLLGQWAVWTKQAIAVLEQCHQAWANDELDQPCLMTLNMQLTDVNAAVFDAANGFHGVIAGVHEVLRRQGLLEGTWCLNLKETLSPGQADEIERVCRAYPHLVDDAFVAEHRDQWLAG